MFLSSESHYLKRVETHPERDEYEVDRIVDQGPDDAESIGRFSSLRNENKTDIFSDNFSCSTISGKKRKYSDFKRSNEQPVRTMSTRSGTKPTTTPKKKSKSIKINDVVEVYLYPKEEEWSQDSSSDDEWDEVFEDPIKINKKEKIQDGTPTNNCNNRQDEEPTFE